MSNLQKNKVTGNQNKQTELIKWRHHLMYLHLSTNAYKMSVQPLILQPVKWYNFGSLTFAHWDIKAPGCLNFLGLKGNCDTCKCWTHCNRNNAWHVHISYPLNSLMEVVKCTKVSLKYLCLVNQLCCLLNNGGVPLTHDSQVTNSVQFLKLLPNHLRLNHICTGSSETNMS
jgi:hypothetical protein